MTGQAATLFDPGFERRTVGGLLRAQASRLGGRTWAIFEDASFTFAEADRLVDVYATSLVSVGVGPEDRVGVMLDNSPEFLLLALALGRLGAVFVPLNLALKGESLAHPIRRSGISTLAIEPGLAGRVLAHVDSLPDLHTLLVREPYDDGFDGEGAGALRVLPLGMLAGTADAGSLPPEPSTFDPWSVMFTSGTTGLAKGAVMTHQYWYLVPAELSGAVRDVRDDDVFYVSSPMFHAAAWLVQIFPSLISGLPVAIDGRFSTSGFWDRVRRFGATQLLTMGASHLWLWNQEPSDDDADNPARVWAPVPLPYELRAPFMVRFGIEHLWSTYGGTEFMSVTNTDVRRPWPAGGSGRARPSVELAVLDDFGRRTAPDEIGELCVRPLVPHAIFGGYLGMPETTLERFRDLWYHTGDLVRIDATGELFFVDRKDDYLRVRGENVASYEVEIAIERHEAVTEVAAYGIRVGDAALVVEDEVMVAVVVREGAVVDPGELLAFAGEQLPHFAVPRYVEFVSDLPRTATGRIQKHLLRARGMTPQTFDRVSAGVTVKR
jgi:crotonobetaine/carnitine-CoA ligase